MHKDLNLLLTTELHINFGDHELLKRDMTED